MSETPETNTPETAPRRPWYRFHFSTYVVAAFLFVALVLIIVPGEWKVEEKRFEHGWPWRYLQRTRVAAPLSSAGIQPGPIPIWDGPPWLHGDGWLLVKGETEFELGALLGDSLVGLLVLLVGTASFEWWRRRRRRIWQFSLRELLIGTLLIAALLGWWRQNRLRSQREFQAIRSFHGRYCHGYDVPDCLRYSIGSTEYPYRTECRAPAWLRKLLGGPPLTDFYAVEAMGYVDSDNTFQPPMDSGHGPVFTAWFQCVQQLPDLKWLVLSQCALTDADIAAIAAFRRIRRLNLHGCTIEKNALRHLADMRDLRHLMLEGSVVDDDDLETIGQLTRLRSLLCEGDLTDKGLRQLAGLTDLEILQIHSDGITNDGLRHLAGLTDLTYLDLRSDRITGDGLCHLSKMTELCYLMLWWTSVNDDSLRHLTELSELEFLWLSHTDITDAGLVHLEAMKGLKLLSLYGTTVTPAGVERLREALPDCEIDFEPSATSVEL